MKKSIKLYLVSLFCLTAFGTFAQSSDTVRVMRFYRMDTNFSMLLAGNIWRYPYAEIGFARHKTGSTGLHPIATAVYASTEVRVGGDQLILGPKIGAYLAGGVSIGASAIYYTNLEEGALRIRPEMGCGVDTWRLTYGYNLPITNGDFAGLNKSVVTLSWLIRLKNLKHEQNSMKF